MTIRSKAQFANAGRNGGAIAAARIACKYLLAPDTPVNEGDFARLDVVIPEEQVPQRPVRMRQLAAPAR